MNYVLYERISLPHGSSCFYHCHICNKVLCCERTWAHLSDCLALLSSPDVVCLIEFCIFPPTALCLIFNSLIPGFIPGSHRRLNSSPHSVSLSVSLSFSHKRSSHFSPKSLKWFLEMLSVNENCIEFITLWKCHALCCARSRSVQISIGLRNLSYFRMSVLDLLKKTFHFGLTSQFLVSLIICHMC